MIFAINTLFSMFPLRSVAMARRLGPGEFRATHIADEDVVVFRADGGTRDVLIITVSASDAIAYDVRSERRVSADLLALYWSALLSDYRTIAYERQPPRGCATCTGARH